MIISIKSLFLIIDELQQEMIKLEFSYSREEKKTLKPAEELSEFEEQTIAFPGHLYILADFDSLGKLFDIYGKVLPFDKTGINSVKVIDEYNNSIDIKIVSSKNFDYLPSVSLDRMQCIVDEKYTLVDILNIARILSWFPDVFVDDISELTNTGLFEELPYYIRRFFFEQILTGRKPSAGLIYLHKRGVLKEILPELTAGENLSQNRFHKYDIFEHLIRSCDGVFNGDFIIRASALFHDIGKVPTRRVKENGEATFYNHEIISAKMVVAIMKRFGIPREVGTKIKFFVRNHMFHYTDEWSDKAIRRFLKKVSQEDFEKLVLLRMADRRGSGKKNALPQGFEKLVHHINNVLARELEPKVTDLDINGNDIILMGASQGPLIGQILKELLNKVNNGELINEKEHLANYVESILKSVADENIVIK